MSINTKIKDAKIRLIQCDWTTDAQYTRPGPKGMPMTINYVSANKIKRNFAPVFAELGLDYKVDMVEAIETDKGGLRLIANVTLTDLDSGETDVTRIISGSPTQDKGESIALTNVMREYFASRFAVVDGLNYEDVDERANLADALAHVAVEPKREDVNIPAVPTEPSQRTFNTLDLPVDTSKSKTEVKSSPVKPLSSMEEKACNKCIEFIEAHKDMIDEAVYTKCKETFDKRSSSADLMDLMEVKRSIEAKIKPAQEGM